jgi:two-component system sensor histidine kinase QseC
MPISLKHRLLLLSLTTVLVVWVAASLFTYFDARAEFEELLDAHLAQSASLLVVQTSNDFDEIETEHAPLLHKYSRQVAFQVWDEARVLRLHSANASAQLLSTKEQGYSDSMIDAKRWRVFSTLDASGGNLIQVAERTEVRDELAENIAGNLLKPLLVSLPLLALLLWIAISHSLRPLVKLTAEVGRREPENLHALAVTSAPAEVLPLIERLNQLFTRMDAVLQNERRFTADAAHELRTPVGGIKAQAQVALAAVDDEQRRHALNNVILGCDRATRLIEQLLTLARIDHLGDDLTESCPLKALAAEVIAQIAPMALKQDVRLELNDGEERVINGHPLLLRVLLRNLIDNAVRHTPSGTRVNIDVSVLSGRTCLSVTDSGPGIPEAELSRVAERFYRPPGTTASGSGLGLSIVKRIAEIHHATLDIEPSNQGTGLTVTLIFNPLVH